MRYDCKVPDKLAAQNLGKKSQMHTTSPETNIQDKGSYRHNIMLLGKYFPVQKREPTYKFIVNNTTGNISALTMHISPNKTQNQLEVYHNRK
jgi:hypothetical protein